MKFQVINHSTMYRPTMCLLLKEQFKSTMNTVKWQHVLLLHKKNERIFCKICPRPTHLIAFYGTEFNKLHPICSIPLVLVVTLEIEKKRLKGKLSRDHFQKKSFQFHEMLESLLSTSPHGHARLWSALRSLGSLVC